MKLAVVVDTNVPVTANGGATQAGGRCILACIESLAEVIQERQILLDDTDRILNEYRRHLSPSGQPGPGDRFFKWLWTNQTNTTRCIKVRITPRDGAESDFAEFPLDPALATFDSNDRKFVAVGLASRRPFMLINATDSDWWHAREALARNGVKIEFLCPDLMPAQGSEQARPRSPAGRARRPAGRASR